MRNTPQKSSATMLGKNSLLTPPTPHRQSQKCKENGFSYRETSVGILWSPVPLFFLVGKIYESHTITLKSSSTESVSTDTKWTWLSTFIKGIQNHYCGICRQVTRFLLLHNQAPVALFNDSCGNCEGCRWYQ